jgi:glycosyltransferase involved in cell wall biosynthesis
MALFIEGGHIQVIHFLLDHRHGGPHAYIASIESGLTDECYFEKVFMGGANKKKYRFTNFKHISSYFYIFDVLINTLLICIYFHRIRGKKKLIFDVHGAANLAPIIASRILGVSLIWHIHETVPSFILFIRFGELLLAGYSRFKFVSVSKKSIAVYKLKNAAFIPPAIDTNFWSPRGAVRSIKNCNQPLDIAVIANINPLKGIDILLDALKKINFPCRVFLIGLELTSQKFYSDYLRRKCKELSELCEVHFLGQKSSIAVRDILKDVDVFILPSRSEAAPISLLEAMSMECPCIASNVGDISQILDGGRVGLLTPPSDTEAILRAITFIKREAKIAMELGILARIHVLNNYSGNKSGAEHLRIYSELIGKV